MPSPRACARAWQVGTESAAAVAAMCSLGLSAPTPPYVSHGAPHAPHHPASYAEALTAGLPTPDATEKQAGGSQ